MRDEKYSFCSPVGFGSWVSVGGALFEPTSGVLAAEGLEGPGGMGRGVSGFTIF